MRRPQFVYRRARRGTPPRLEAKHLKSNAEDQQGRALPTAHFFIAFMAFMAFIAFMAFFMAFIAFMTWWV